MKKFGISWSMVFKKRSFNRKTRCCFWVQELDVEWKIKTICERNKSRNPAELKIWRKSLGGEYMISGELEMHDESKRLLLKKKFVTLLEKNDHSSNINLNYPLDVAKPYPEIFLLTGEICISSRLVEHECLPELVHLSTLDFSSLRQLSSDMECLMFEYSLFADANLKCGSITIPVNKTILSVRSSVFKTIFSCQLKKYFDKEVIIIGMEPQKLQAFVKYWYTGKTEDLIHSFQLFPGKKKKTMYTLTRNTLAVI